MTNKRRISGRTRDATLVGKRKSSDLLVPHSRLASFPAHAYHHHHSLFNSVDCACFIYLSVHRSARISACELRRVCESARLHIRMPSEAAEDYNPSCHEQFAYTLLRNIYEIPQAPTQPRVHSPPTQETSSHRP